MVCRVNLMYTPTHRTEFAEHGRTQIRHKMRLEYLINHEYCVCEVGSVQGELIYDNYRHLGVILDLD